VQHKHKKEKTPETHNPKSHSHQDANTKTTHQTFNPINLAYIAPSVVLRLYNQPQPDSSL
jgi:hypothetical protein